MSCIEPDESSCGHHEMPLISTPSNLHQTSRDIFLMNELNLHGLCLKENNLSWPMEIKREYFLNMLTKLVILSQLKICCYTPGRLLSDFGHDASHNQYHGNKNFHNVAMGLIQAENQASWSGETLMAKEQFEQLLWDGVAAEICHLYCDNGITNTKLIVEKWKKHTQSCSGIRAHHQMHLQ